MSDNCEINYEILLDALRKRMDKILDAQEEYFSLLNVITEKAEYQKAVADNLMRLPMVDQVKYLRHLAKAGAVCEKLCEKYNLLSDVEESHD